MSWLDPHLQSAAAVLGLPANVLLVIGAIFIALVLGTILRLTHLHKLPPETGHSLLLRLRTWWIIAAILALVVLLGRPAIVSLFALVSLVALREYFSLLPDRSAVGQVIVWAYLAVPVQYLCIYLGAYELFLIFVPVVFFLLLTTRVVLMQDPDSFLPVVGSLHWAVMILVFCLSHAAYLLALPDDANPAGGAIGWFLYLVLLTESNDIAQALWGRPFGRHKILPRISPGKSWEGTLGGIGCTMLLAVLLGPLLTQFSHPQALVVGFVIAVAGFLGDVTMSSLKRYCHVKDSGTLLPGQGGILDRIDSLTFTAPFFFHYVHTIFH